MSCSDKLRDFISDARVYLKRKYLLDLEDLYLEFKRYDKGYLLSKGFSEDQVFSHAIEFFNKKGFNKGLVKYFQSIAKEYYACDIAYIDVIKYLCAEKNLYSYKRQRESSFFRERKKYIKNRSIQRVKDTAQLEKESYRRFKFKPRDKQKFFGCYYWDRRRYSKKERLRNKLNILSIY